MNEPLEDLESDWDPIPTKAETQEDESRQIRCDLSSGECESCS